MAFLKPRCRFQTRRAFSLVELAMVLVATGLVVGMGTQLISSKTAVKTDNEASIKGCYTQTHAALNTMNAAVQQFFVHNGYYPMPATTDTTTTSGKAVNYGDYGNWGDAGKVVVDDTTAPKVAIGYFPYATVGLQKSFAHDCFNDADVKISTYANPNDSYYRYTVSLDSAGDSTGTVKDSIYKSHTQHGAITINLSDSASLHSTAIFNIVSHGSTGCPAAGMTNAKKINCTTSYTAAAPYTGAAYYPFTRNTGDPKFFDDMVVYYGNKDNACAPGPVTWPPTGIKCLYNVPTPLKPGVTITATVNNDSANINKQGTAGIICKANGGTYTLQPTGSCGCIATGAVPHGHIDPLSCGIVCDTTPAPGYALIGGSCLPIIPGQCNPTVAGTCIKGVPTSDNNDTTCTENHTWTCQGQNTGADASCSITNPTCVCSPATVANGTVGSYPACDISCNIGYNKVGSSCVANTCTPATVANGTVAAYPACDISCNMGYHKVGSSCVADTCTPATVANGTVGAYPACNISCNIGYSQVGSSCILDPACSPATVAHGHVSAYPACSISCDPPYTVSSSSCACPPDTVANSTMDASCNISCNFGYTMNSSNTACVHIYTGTWSPATCSTACGYPGGNIASHCSTGNDSDCDPGSPNATTSCGAVPATGACAPHGSCGNDSGMNPCGDCNAGGATNCLFYGAPDGAHWDCVGTDAQLVHCSAFWCFKGDTIITMADGSTKLISELEVGDAVKGRHGINHITVARNFVTHEAIYSINDSDPFVTGGHPFMTKKGWRAIDPQHTPPSVKAELAPKKMQIGDEILLETGDTLKVESLTPHDNTAGTTVYNPSLDGDHTYYANGMLVHNK